MKLGHEGAGARHDAGSNSTMTHPTARNDQVKDTPWGYPSASADDNELASLITEIGPLVQAALGAPGELSREIEDLRTLMAECRIELRRRRTAQLAEALAAVAA